MNLQNRQKKNRALVFGAFDGLHDGHLSLLKSALQYANEVTIALARDEVIRELKSHDPKFAFTERMKALENTNLVHHVIPGDLILGEYTCIRHAQPEIIVLGYDQEALEQDLKRWLNQHNLSIELIHAPAFKPDIYKSSLLNYD